MVEYRTEQAKDPAAGNLDMTYAALSSPVRRAMLERLRHGETRVTDLARPFDMSLAAASKHVQQLERAGLVRRRVEGRVHWLAIEPRPLDQAARWIQTYREFWDARLDALESFLAERADPAQEAGPAS
jgi:DNA-binding transcriptional ArsR family regulator